MDRDPYEVVDEQSISTELRSTASEVTPILQLFHFHLFNSFKKRKNVSLYLCLSSPPLYILQTPSDRERINSSLSTSLLLSLALGFPSLRFFDLGLQFLFFAYAFDFFFLMVFQIDWLIEFWFCFRASSRQFLGCIETDKCDSLSRALLQIS